MTRRIALFIDGVDLHLTSQILGFEIDYKRLIFEFERYGSVVRSYFYIPDASDSRQLAEWLSYNGFMVRTSPSGQEDPAAKRVGRSRNIGVSLVVDALEIAREVDGIFLFSGDGNFRALVQGLQRLGVRVTVVSSVKTRPAAVSDGLRRQADAFLELETLKASIGRQTP